MYSILPWSISKVYQRNILMMNGVPAQSQLASIVASSYFSDSFEQRNSDVKNMTAIEILHQSVTHLPSWIDSLLYFRNKSCKYLFGLKDVGTFSDFKLTKPLNELKPGDKMAIFTLVSINDNEVVFEDNDKHLHGRFSNN